MSIKIGHASIDENGKIAGGKVGDQTGREICIREWWDKPWNVYLECTDLVIANKAAVFVEQVCADPNYGYDQYERLTGYTNIDKNKDKVKGAKGEFDCSSLDAAAYKFAGLDVNISSTTRNLRKNLLATGKFKEYTDKAHLTSDKYAKRGSLFLSEGHHVVMALEDGNYTIPTRTIEIGCEGDDVKWVQQGLINDGITYVIINGKRKKLSIDGECGAITAQAIRDYQTKHKLFVDGQVGPITRESLKSN
jgi:hypothetical protein